MAASGAVYIDLSTNSPTLIRRIYEVFKEKNVQVLDAIGDKVSYIGATGCGAIAKLVHNMIAICTQVVLAEGLSLGVKAGVDPEALRQAVADGAFGQGVILNYLVPHVVFAGDYDTVRFAEKLARKDIGLATDLARDFNVPLRIGHLVEEEHVEAIARGWGERDATVPFALQEERAGVKVRTAKA